MNVPLRERIAAPRLTGHHAPFWFWNGPLDPDTMRAQVALMAEQGVTGAMPHPRFGMDRRDYLEDAYWKAMDATVDEAARVGSHILLYDEYNWPSGAAGGRVLEGHPEFLPRALDYAVREIEGPGTAMLDGFSAGETFSGVFERVMAAFLVPDDCPHLAARADDTMPARADADRPEAWGTVAADGRSISGTAPEGRRRVLVFFRSMCGYPSRLNIGSDAFIGYLQPGAVERFIALTHDAYAKRYQRHFGTLIPAIFTDEPSTISPGPFPWCDDFAEQFRARRGFELMAALPALCDDRHPDGAKVRGAYWQTVAELFDERFFKRIGDWCRDHGIAFTGHAFDEDIAAWPCVPQLMDFLRRMDWPGIDALGPHAHAAGCKIAASVAHLENKPHFLCEALGLAGGWNATFAMLKRGYHYLGAMGVDYFVPHAFHQTVENPRVECPPSFFYQNPYYPYYHRIAALTDRLSAFNRSGPHVAPVAVYYPAESLWADGTGGRGQGGYPWQQKSRGNAHAVRTADTFNAALEALSAGPFDCDAVDAAALRKAMVDQGRGELCIAAERFGALILPDVRTIAADILPVIEAFVHGGGTLVIAGTMLSRTHPASDMDVTGILDRLAAHPGGGRVVRIATADVATLVPILAAHLIPTIRFPQGKPAALCVMARRAAESAQWLMVNDGASPIACEVLLPRERLPQASAGQTLVVTRVDIDTGAITPLAARVCEEGLTVDLRLGDTEAAVLVVEAATCATRIAPVPAEPAREKMLTDWTFQLVPMESCDINTKSVWLELPVFRWQARGPSTPRDWTRPDLNDSGWTPVAAVRGEALVTAQVPLFRGTLPPGARALRQPIPASGEYVLYVNGVCVEERLGPPAPDGMLRLDGCAGLGDTIALETCSESGLSGLTAPLVVECGPVKLPRLQSWTDMGLWWYAGRACYRTDLHCDAVPERAILDLGTVEHYAEIWVNGKQAGLCLWPPYRIDIAPFLTAGKNELRILISNSIANRFLWDRWSDARTGASWGVPPKAEPSGLLGPVRLLTLPRSNLAGNA